MNERDIIELVLARLQTMPDNLELHMGGNKVFDKQQLIKHVKQQDEIGKFFTQKQIEYIKASMKGFA